MSAAPLVICAPLAGTVVALADVPDEVFAAGMVGPGVAIEPDRSATTAYCPVEGVVSKLHPHAFVIESGPKAVLTHLGIDTVELAGDGFIILAQEGDRIEIADPVVKWDPTAVAAGGNSPSSSSSHSAPLRTK
jgi:PTS system glucose-specific IIA component